MMMIMRPSTLIHSVTTCSDQQTDRFEMSPLTRNGTRSLKIGLNKERRKKLTRSQLTVCETKTFLYICHLRKSRTEVAQQSLYITLTPTHETNKTKQW